MIVSFKKSEAAKKHSVKVPIDTGCLGKGTGGKPVYRDRNFLKCFAPVLYVFLVDGDKAESYSPTATFEIGSAPITCPKASKSSRVP